MNVAYITKDGMYHFVRNTDIKPTAGDAFDMGCMPMPKVELVVLHPSDTTINGFKLDHLNKDDKINVIAVLA